MQSNYNKKMQTHQMNQLCYVPADRSGQRLDNYLFLHFKQFPKSAIYRWIRKGAIRVNGKKVKTHARIEAGDCIRLPCDRYPQQTAAMMQAEREKKADFSWLKPYILFENDAFIVLNKPAGLAVHAGTQVYTGLIEGLKAYYGGGQKVQDMALVHRLDRNTSGCLLVAKKYSSIKALQRALSNDTTEKYYLAVVHGVWTHALPYAIRYPLSKNRLCSGERRVRVDPEQGKAAYTEVVGAWVDTQRHLSVLRLRLHTGRTHQIRVHLQEIGYPIINDDKYAPRAVSSPFSWRRLCLHADSIKFSLDKGSSKETHAFRAPVPSPLCGVIREVCG